MLDWVSSAVSDYGLIALFLAAVVEGPIAAVLGAFLASQGMLHLFDVFLIAVSADMVGDVVLYGVGRTSHRLPACVQRSRARVSQRLRFSSLMEAFRTHPGKVLVTAKLTHAAGFVVLMGAGVARIPLNVFLGFNFLATLPKAAAFVALGYFVGEAYSQIDHYLWLFSCVVLVVLAVAAFAYMRKVAKPVPQKDKF